MNNNRGIQEEHESNTKALKLVYFFIVYYYSVFHYFKTNIFFYISTNFQCRIFYFWNSGRTNNKNTVTVAIF